MFRRSGWGIVAMVAAATLAGGCARSELLGEIGVGPADADRAADSAVDAATDAAVVAVTHIIVATDGSGQFTTVQGAVNSIPAGNTSPIEIDIRPGTYDEKVNVTGKNNIALVGQDAMTTTITYDDDANSAGSTTNSASTTIIADDFAATNITFENRTPLTGVQGVAIYTNGKRIQFSNCRFVSFQDTVYIKAGTQYFRGCYIAGDDDYILGAATAVFHACTLFHNADGVAVTAPNTDMATGYGVVFLGGSLSADPSVKPASVALGRPWGAYGATIYVDTILGAHISPVGWVPMNNNDLTYARFAEYKTTGPGANPSMRAPTARQLSDSEAAALTIPVILGGWIPSFSR